MRTLSDLIAGALDGEIICNIGQIDKPTARALDKLVRGGKLAKWRGHWYPIAGANFGMGPLKTCWGIPAYLNCPAVSNPSSLNRIEA
jgi:hypothetical protein